MEILALILLGIGLPVALVGYVWVLIRAFKSGIWWGVLVLCCSPGWLIWSWTHRDDAKIPGLILLAGGVLALVGMKIMPAEPTFLADLFGSTPSAPVVSSVDTTPRVPISSQKELNQELVTAAEQGDLARVQQALSKGAQINARNAAGSTSLIIALQKGNIELAKMLLDKDPDITAKNDLGVTALFPAARNGYLALAKIFIEKGIDVNAKTEKGLTALIVAVNNDRPEIVKLLIANGADVNAKNDAGKTVLSLAKTPEIFQMLQAAGAGAISPEEAQSRLAQADIRYNEGVFIQYAEKGDFRVVKLFLAAGVNPNVQDEYEATALMHAANKGYTQMAKLLIEKGADVNIKTSKGLTALKIATLKNHTEIIQLLQNAGAKE